MRCSGEHHDDVLLQKLARVPRGGGVEGESSEVPPLHGLTDARRAGGGDSQAVELARAEALLRHAPAGERQHHPDGAGAARPQMRGDDYDLPARHGG